MKTVVKSIVASMVLLMAGGLFQGSEAQTQNWTLSKEQRKAYLHYYSPIILKRAHEADPNIRFPDDPTIYKADISNDWMTNWYFDNQGMQNSNDKRAWEGHFLRDNKDHWRDNLANYINSGGIGYPNWDIRPTMYTSIIEFMEMNSQGVKTKCLILMYHPYFAYDLASKTIPDPDPYGGLLTVGNEKNHDWESIVIRINNVNGTPNNNDEISYVTITNHTKDISLKGSDYPNIQFYSNNNNGRHVLLWRAQQSKISYDGHYGGALYFVNDQSIVNKPTSDSAKVNIFNSINGNTYNVNYHYIFADGQSKWPTYPLTTLNMSTSYSGKNVYQGITVGSVKNLAYELQDIADIIPTMDHGSDWEDACEYAFCNDFEISMFRNAILSEDGAIVEVPADYNDHRHFHPVAKGDEDFRCGYVTKDWFWGRYGDQWYGDFDEIEQYYFAPMRELISPDNGWSNNAQNSRRYALPNNWFVADSGGFDGRWAQLFEDSQMPFLPQHGNVTNEFGMNGQAWGAERRNFYSGDFNGDGKDDILLQGRYEDKNTYLLTAHQNELTIFNPVVDITNLFEMTGRRWGADRRLLHIGDFNGDGRKDVLLQSGDDNNQAYILYGQASGNIFSNALDISSLYGMSMRTWGNDRRILHVGDFNGDGKDDILLQGRDDDKSSVILFGQAGTGFTGYENIDTKYQMDKQKWGYDRRILHVADFNGDGRDDILLQGKYDDKESYILLSKPGGTMSDCFLPVANVSGNYSMDRQKWGNDRRMLAIGDFNGDGRKDIVLQGKLDDKESYMLMANSGSTSISNLFANVNNVSESFGMDRQAWGMDRRLLHVLDFDGNGRDDILLQGQLDDKNTYMLIANTVSVFDNVKEVSYSYGMDQRKWGNDRRILHVSDFNGDHRSDIMLQGRLEDKENYLLMGTKSFSVQISGPSSRSKNQSGTWTAETVGGGNAFTYQWYKNGTYIGNTKSITTSGSSNFSLKVVAAATNYGLKDSIVFNVTVTGLIDPMDKTGGIPLEFALDNNYPNPFNPTTTIKYALKEDVKVSLKIYNVLGQEVRTLVNENQGAGFKQAIWDGKNNNGSQVTSGIYVYRLVAGNFVKSHKMMLMK